MKEFKAARKKDLNMMSSPKSRKRKMKKPPQPPRAAKARPPTKTIEVDEEHDSLDFGYIVQQLLTGDGGESISDHPSSSTSSNRREESVPVGSLSPSPISLPPVSPNAFTSRPLPPSPEEDLSIYDYGGWEEPAAPYPFLKSFVPNINNLRMINNPPLLSNPSSNFYPFYMKWAMFLE